MHASFPEYLVLRELMPASVRSAHAERVHDAEHWAELCVQLGASESDVYSAAAAYFDIPFLSEHMIAALEDASLDRAPVPRAYLDAAGFSVLRRLDDVLICAGYRIPQDQSLQQLMNRYNARRVLLCASTPTAIRAHVRRSVQGPLEVVDEAISEATHEISLESMNLERFPEVPREFNKLLLHAIKSRASDIHVERGHHRAAVRFRIDGAFVNVETPWLTTENVLAFVTKIKVDSALDIAERRRPQDGVLRRRIGTRMVDFRVAIQPTLWGESVVLRVLDQSKGAPLLDELGMSAVTLNAFRRLLDNPHGLILLTGPTGSGKTTTLYAALQELKKNNLKIVTAEDPVEYAMEGIQQSAVDEGIGNTFDRFLRAFLRQDPDVILVGEIRDSATAEMTLRAALTGHLVFSTLHVNDAAGTVSRLRDLGVSLNVLSESLLCVVGQRLVRRVCSTCAQPTTLPKSLIEECFGTGAPADATFLSGRGCDVCRGTGYKGRVALVELWAPSVVERDLIQRGASSLELREHALSNGLWTMLEDAREKMASGITTPQEVRAAMSYEELHRVKQGRS